MAIGNLSANHGRRNSDEILEWVCCNACPNLEGRIGVVSRASLHERPHALAF